MSFEEKRDPLSPSDLQQFSSQPPYRQSRHRRLFLLVPLIFTLIWARLWYFGDPLSHILPCPGRPGVQCGFVEVPKDYTLEIPGFTLIAYARIPALKKPSKGTIFVNPGGPGGSGKSLVFNRGAALQIMLGEQWDIVGFDPRGIGDTIPVVQCYSDPMEEKLFKANTVLERAITIPSNITALVKDTSSLEAQFGEFLRMKEIQAKKCAEKMGQELMFTGTSDVVRDMREMKRWFDPTGKINYWGGSYGSILGTYLVNMLPDEVGLVAIDGIADPVLWSSEPSHKWHKQWVDSAEDTYQIFLNQCIDAGPELCSLAQHGNTSLALEELLDDWFDKLISDPLLVPDGSRPGFLTSGQARASVFSFLNSPARWSDFAEWMSSALDGNATDIYNFMVKGAASGDNQFWWEPNRLAVTCMDSPTEEFPTAKDLAEEGLRALRVSRFGLSTTVQEPDGGCQYWPYKPKDRFNGPWNATLETPMLIVTNTADPITPKRSALRINSLMPDSSSVIVYDSPGHCSLSTTRTFTPPCVAKHVKAYFNGIVPPNGTFCPNPGNVFEWQGVTKDDLQDMSDEDIKLAEAAMIVWSGYEN